MKKQMIIAIQEGVTPLPKGEIIRLLGVEILPGIGAAPVRHFIVIIERDDE